MARPWVPLTLWLASALAGCGEAATRDPAPAPLTQEALADPRAVARSLERKPAPSARVAAEKLAALAASAQAQANWSRAAKAYGESAVFYPAPRTLIGYAEAFLHDIAAVRARTGDTASARADLTHASGIYRSALAADDLVPQLSASEKKGAADAASCLEAHIAGNAAPGDCRPLKIYARRS